MRLRCNNGFYKFFPDFVGEVKLLQSKSGFKLYPCGDFWTFKELAEFPNYSIKGQTITSIIPAVSTYAGKPEDVLEKNKLTYNLKLETITPRAVCEIQLLDYADGAYYTFPNMPQAYARDKDLQVISGFEAFVDVRLGTYKLERLFYENI